MNRSLVIGVILKLSGIFAVGLLGYFIGLRGNEEEVVVSYQEPIAEKCSSVQLKKRGLTDKNSKKNFAREAVSEGSLDSANPEARLGSQDNAVSPGYQDIEEGIQAGLSADESVVVQESERLPDVESGSESTERIRVLTEDKQLKYVKALAENQDDASIVELKELITFDNETVRHAAVDSLIKIMDQETGHYDAVEAALADNAVFLDGRQMAKFNKISSRVVKRGAEENPAPAF